MISLKNNAQSVLAMSVDTHQTQLNLSLGDGVKFPDLSLGDHFRCCLKDAAGNLEFVKEYSCRNLLCSAVCIIAELGEENKGNTA